jgi:type I restriction enzyme S subunit
MMFYKETTFEQTPIGEFPKDWKTVTLGDVVNVKGGKRLLKGEKLVDFNTGFPYIRVVDFKNGTVDVSGIKYLLPESHAKIKHYTISSNDVYISIAGTIGLAGLVPKELDGANLTENAAKLSDLTEVKKEFLAYLLNSEVLKEQIVGLMGKGTQPKFALFRIKSLRLALPNLKEQERIAEVLGVVDSAIELVDKVIAKTERLKKGLMQELLTRGIGHKEYTQTPIGKTPKTWEVEKLGNVVTYEKGKAPKALLSNPVQNTVPYLNAESLRTGSFTQWGEVSEEVITAHEYDVLLIWDGFYCGDAFTGYDGILSSTMIRIRTNTNHLNNRFLFYILKTHFKELNTKISGMYLKHVNKHVFESLKIPIPPISEQQSIVEMLSHVDKKLELERREKAKLERIKLGLMDLLLTGKIRVKVD